MIITPGASNLASLSYVFRVVVSSDVTKSKQVLTAACKANRTLRRMSKILQLFGILCQFKNRYGAIRSSRQAIAP